ncbi:type 1 fimbrial protein [Providencia alcalifaciens]|uniref:fimbrial protein n=1 Tax=Providencia alcalifaciens TaxID=126385 RepID=UPI001CE08574|nr:fimbrial protein [Providencia alcalifaciens]UBX50613.1 type 1 fimbrial protein [Providencia alcalifaciens]
MKALSFKNLTIGIGFLFINPGFTADGNIEFIGDIIDQACEVKTESKNIRINLGQIPKANFPSVGSKSTSVPFSIKLINCPIAITSAKVSFDATPYTNDNTVIALKSTSNATGVGVQLTDDRNAVITLLSSSSEYPLLSNFENDLNFTANYIAKAIPVTPGSANASAPFLIIYN